MQYGAMQDQLVAADRNRAFESVVTKLNDTCRFVDRIRLFAFGRDPVAKYVDREDAIVAHQKFKNIGAEMQPAIEEFKEATETYRIWAPSGEDAHLAYLAKGVVGTLSELRFDKDPEKWARAAVYAKSVCKDVPGALITWFRTFKRFEPQDFNVHIVSSAELDKLFPSGQ